jgi:hypothetical protein
MSSDAPRCPRHPDTPTRLSCSSCGGLICPACAHDAATGYHCPDCVARDRGQAASSDATVLPWPGGRGRARGGPSGASSGGPRLPTVVGAKATAVGLIASIAGGLVLGPVLQGGAFFLLSSGLIGWAVARAVFWATQERTSPYVRAIALTLAGFAVAVGSVAASGAAATPGIQFLAYPAALYGGWIVVRQR